MEQNNIKSVIKAKERYTEISSGDMTRIAGVSKETINSNNIHLAIATIPPGKSSSAHYHINCESAIYVLSGEGIFIAGEKLDNHNTINEGDFIYVPPNAPHKPVNSNSEKPLVLMVSRNQPTEIVEEISDEHQLNQIIDPKNCSVINSKDVNLEERDYGIALNGISKITANIKNISLTSLIINPGQTTMPHSHPGHETGVFISHGEGIYISNKQLDFHQNIQKEDFIYIDKNSNHKISNTSSSEKMKLIIARNIGI